MVTVPIYISVTGTNCEKIEAFIAKCNGAAEDDDPETEENYTSMGEQSGENYSKSQTITECGYYHVKAVGKNGSWINGGLTDEVKVDMVVPNLYSC